MSLRRVVGEYQCHQLAFALHNHRLYYARHVVQLILYLLRIDVLPRRTENHVLAASAQEEVTCCIQHAEVARAHPTILGEHCFRRLFVLVVAFHHVHALHLHLAFFMLRVFRIYADVALRKLSTARVEYETLPWRVRNQRSTLRHAITNAVAEVYVFQHLLYLFVQRRAADNQVAQLVAERCHQAVVHFLANHILDNRSVPQHLHHGLVNHREYFLLDNLLYHEGHRQNHVRVHLREGFHQCRWGGGFRQEVRARARAYLIQELECQAKGVGDRKHRYHLVVVRTLDLVEGEFNVARHILLRQHNALRSARRTRGVVDNRQLLQVIRRIIHILARYAVRILVGKQGVHTRVCYLNILISSVIEREIVHEDNPLQRGHLFGFNLVAHVRTHIQ